MRQKGEDELHLAGSPPLLALLPGLVNDFGLWYYANNT